MSFLSRLCQAFAKNHLRYAIVGGHAVALHGAVRGTVDVDVVLNWDLRSLQAAESILAGLGMVSRLPIGASDMFRFRDEYIRNRNLIAWNFYNPHDMTEQVDIVVTYDLRGRRRVRVDTADGPVHVLGRNDLIDMKRASGRPQDLEDADALESLR